MRRSPHARQCATQSMQKAQEGDERAGIGLARVAARVAHGLTQKGNMEDSRKRVQASQSDEGGKAGKVGLPKPLQLIPTAGLSPDP